MQTMGFISMIIHLCKGTKRENIDFAGRGKIHVLGGIYYDHCICCSLKKNYSTNRRCQMCIKMKIPEPY